jgi:hypothetical protein
MEGTRGRSFVIFILILILILNILSVPVMAPEGELEIVADSMSKEVLPGEDAVFYWTAYNNDTYTSYDLSASSPGTEFSESSFTLEPGESKLVIQTASTSINDTNDTHYSYKVTWNGIWHQGPVSGSIIPMEGMITVKVINSTNFSGNGEGDGGSNGENGEDDNNGDDSTPGFESIFLIGAILVALILVRKKRKKVNV